MSLFKRLKDLTDEINYCINLEVHDCIFKITEDAVYYNEDNDPQDLENLDGNTFGGELTGGYLVQDDCLFVNYDNGCGDTITLVFNKSNLRQDGYYSEDDDE